MERAMRDQEEELLLSEAHRRPDVTRPRRSFWIEEDGEWGLITEADLDEIDKNSVMWVGNRSSEHDWVEDAAWSTFLPDGHEMTWQWFGDDFYAADVGGAFWSWTETKTWLDCQECLAMFPQDGQKLEEILLALMNACARFVKAGPWALNNAKQISRGYDPLSMVKGKNQSKGKGKRKGSYDSKKGSSSFGCGWKRDVKGPETRQSWIPRVFHMWIKGTWFLIMPKNDRTSQLSSPRVPHLPVSTPAPFSWSCLPESEESETIPITADWSFGCHGSWVSWVAVPLSQ